MEPIEYLSYLEMEKVFADRFSKELKNNAQFHDHLEREAAIVRGANTVHSYTVMEFLLISYDKNDKEWSIDFVYSTAAGTLRHLLNFLRKDYALKLLVYDLIEIAKLVKLILTEESEFKMTPLEYVITELKKGLIALELKDSLEKNYGYDVFLAENSDDTMLVIPDLRTKLFFIEEDQLKNTILFRENSLFLPYVLKEDTEDLLEFYFENKLVNHLENIKLMRIYDEIEVKPDIAPYFNRVIEKRASSVFIDREDKDFYSGFLKANSNIDIKDVIQLSAWTSVPNVLLDDAIVHRYELGSTYVLKTQHGIYYLKEDHQSIGYLSLVKLYDRADEAELDI